MAQNITLLGASYSEVPAVTLPKTGGGTASFIDVTDTTAAASDVASGKYFYTASGVRTQGTASGGGSGLTLLATKSLGTISTSSTTATDTGQTVSVPNAKDYDLLIVVTACTKTNNRHWCTEGLIWLYNSSDITNGRNAATVYTTRQNWRVSSSAVVTSRTNSYGIYANSCSLSNGTATLAMYQRYQSSSTGTINGNYTTKVYGVKLYDLFGS